MNYKKLAQQYLHQWMTENNLTGDYVIHHRDDNDEVRTYNKANYKLWGHNLDGTFEYGKYVVFITRSEHMHHHRLGAHLTEEQRAHLSEINSGEKHPKYGTHHSEETRKKLSQQKLGSKNPMYQKDFTEEHRRHLRESYAGNRPEVKAKIVEATRKRMQRVGELWHIYKQNNGPLSWPEFQSNIAKNNIPSEYLTLNGDNQ